MGSYSGDRRIGVVLGVLDLDVEVAVAIEDARVHELKLRFFLSGDGVLMNEPFVWELLVWVLVKHPTVGVGRGGIKVPIALFDILPVIAL